MGSIIKVNLRIAEISALSLRRLFELDWKSLVDANLLPSFRLTGR